jgi:protein SCO1/2
MNRSTFSKWMLSCLVAIPLLAAAEPTLTETSLYNLSGQWSDQNGKQIGLAQLGEKVQVLAMIYTHCQATCPAIIEAMRKTEVKLTAAEGKQVGFVLVSIDPEVDTAEKLKSFAQERKLGPSWCLLRGDADDVLELAATLNFKYRKTSKKDYAHSAMITVLDRHGDVVHQQLGLTGGADERLAAIRKALK